MADINPQTTFHLALNEREYHVVMLGLAKVAGADVSVTGEARKRAAELNVKLLEREQHTITERQAAIDRKRDKAAELLTAAMTEG